jgi:hypothetical protein
MKNRILMLGGAVVALLLVGLVGFVRPRGESGAPAAVAKAADAAPAPTYVAPPPSPVQTGLFAGEEDA